MSQLSVRPILLAAVLALPAFAAEPAEGIGFFEERFRQLDKDHDGRVTAEEAGNAAWFRRFDRTNKGYLTLDEVRTLVRLAEERGILSAGGNNTLPGTPDASASDDTPRSGPHLLRGVDHGVGRLVPDLAFTDLAGRSGRLSDYKSSRALVIAFTSTSCPVTKKYAPALARLEKEYAARGVAFLFVNPIATDTPASIREVMTDNAFAGRYVPDRDGKLAAALGATTTAEVFVLDAARTLVFRGAIDDQYGVGYALEAPRRTFLRDALTAVLAGHQPVLTATEAPGCALDQPATPTAAPAVASITYHNRISRLVQSHCAECHHPGGLAPFSLETFDDVKSHAAMMRKQVTRGAMPPWFAAPGAAGESSHWRNDRSLPAADKADLLAWLAGDRPLGDPADAPLPRTYPTGWQIGKPDLILQLPKAVAIKAEGIMAYQTLTVATTLTEDKWVQALEVRPTSPAVVHHVIVKVHPPGSKVRGEEGNDGAGEREGFFAAYVPGNSYHVFPAGFAKKLPAGSTVSFQMHYTPNGKATTDQTEFGLIFSAEPPRHVIRVAGLAGPRLSIPPGAPDHLETVSLTVPHNTTILGFTPHMHVRGKAARYEATLPDGTKRVLLDVPRYDFNWQLTYKLAEPVTLPRGTRLTFSAWYDNSSGNPANPDPAKNVRWGPQTYDEMMLGYVEYYIPAQSPRTVSLATP